MKAGANWIPAVCDAVALFVTGSQSKTPDRTRAGTGEHDAAGVTRQPFPRL
jgi:hypothetical protein